MQRFWILFTVVIVIGLAAVAYSQRDRLGSPSTSAEPSKRIDDGQSNAAQISDLKTQLQELRTQLPELRTQLQSLEKQDGAEQIADLKTQLAREQGERKMLTDQLGALSARVDGLSKVNPPEAPPQAAQKRRR